MITLGGIVLTTESDLIWSDRYASSKVEMTTRRTLGGRFVVMTGELVAGRLVTLQATENYGWLKRSIVDAVTVLADVPGASYELLFGAESYTVMFDHTSPPAVDMHPIVPRTEQSPDDYMTGTLKLITV